MGYIHMRYFRLNQRGFGHVMVAVASAVGVGLVGTVVLVLTHANPWHGVLEVYSRNSGYCLTATGGSTGSTVVLDPCFKRASNNQVWTLNDIRTAAVLGASNVQEFTLQSAAGSNECLNNWGSSKEAGNAMRLYTCNSGDAASAWGWGAKGYSSHQLVNLASISGGSGLCLDDWGGSNTRGTEVDAVTCKTGSQPKGLLTFRSVYAERSLTSRGVIACGRISGTGGDGRHPGVSCERVAQGGEGADAVLGGGRYIAADGVPVRVACSERSLPEIFCWVLAGRTSRSAWLEVEECAGRQEPEHVVLAVAQAFQQQPGGGCCTLARGAGVRRQAGGRRGGTASGAGRRPGPGRRPGLLAGEVRGVDQGRSASGLSGQIARGRTGLLCQIAQQVSGAELVGHAGNLS